MLERRLALERSKADAGEWQVTAESRDSVIKGIMAINMTK